MVLPNVVYSIYRRYKQDTNDIATWLASHARLCGYSIVPEATASPQQGQLGGRLKGKARKEAKAAPQKPKPPATQYPKYLIQMKEFVPMAQLIAAYKTPSVTVPKSLIDTLERVITLRSNFDKQPGFNNTASNPTSRAGHQHFVGLLEAVRDVLKPCMEDVISPTPSAHSEFSPLKDENSNRFESLSLHEPSQKFLDAPDIERPSRAIGDTASYVAEEQASLNDALFALVLLLDDLKRVRHSIHQMWAFYRDGSFDIAVVALTTNTAIELVRAAIDEVTPLFEAHGGFWKLLHSFFSACCLEKGYTLGTVQQHSQSFEYATYDLSSELFVLTYRLLEGFFKIVQPNNAPLFKEGHFGSYNPVDDWTRLSGARKYREDRILLMEILPDLVVLNRSVRDYPVMDELTKAVGETCRTQKITFHLVFAAQIFLDIHHILRGDCARAFSEATVQTTMIMKEVKTHLDFHKGIKNVLWKSSNDKFLQMLVAKIEFFQSDPIWRSKQNLWKRLHTSTQISLTKDQTLKRSPILSGLLLAHFRLEMYEVGITVANTWGSLMAAAHLYNALQREALVGLWEDMRVVMDNLESNSFFAGEAPKEPQDYLKKFALQLGVSVSMFAKTRRQSEKMVESRTGPRGIKERLPVTMKLKPKNTHASASANWTMADVENIIAQGSFEDDTASDGTLTTSKLENLDKVKVRKKDVFDSLSVHMIIRRLVLALQSETIESMFSYLTMHRYCWELLREVRDACDAQLQAQYSYRYLERETELPSLAGYIFSELKGKDGPLMQEAARPFRSIINSDRGGAIWRLSGIPLIFRKNSEPGSEYDVNPELA